MEILHIYRFPDGTKAFFTGGDRKCHIIARPDESLEFGIGFKRMILKEMKIGYENWRKRYAS